jgi:hypothetical protein
MVKTRGFGQCGYVTAERYDYKKANEQAASSPQVSVPSPLAGEGSPVFQRK